MFQEFQERPTTFQQLNHHVISKDVSERSRVFIFTECAHVCWGAFRGVHLAPACRLAARGGCENHQRFIISIHISSFVIDLQSSFESIEELQYIILKL